MEFKLFMPAWALRVTKSREGRGKFVLQPGVERDRGRRGLPLSPLLPSVGNPPNNFCAI